MSAQSGETGTRLSPVLSAVGLSLAVPILTLWAVGDLSTSRSNDPDYGWGPYHLDPHWELAVGTLAAVVAVVAMVSLVHGVVRKESNRRAWGVLVSLCGAGAVAAAGWRVETAGVDGANIGGDALVLVGPCLIAGLLVGAAVLSTAEPAPARRISRTARIVAAGLVAPVLFAVLLALSIHDGSIGVISQHQYAGVRVGESRSALHHGLGQPSRDSYQFFAPIRAGVSCDYYVESNAGTSPDALVFRFCFSADVLVSKDQSNQIYSS